MNRTPSPSHAGRRPDDATTVDATTADPTTVDVATHEAAVPRTRAEARAAREEAERARRAERAARAQSSDGGRRRAATAPVPTSRIQWMDAARAASVLAVVAFHIGYIHFLPLVQSAPNFGTKAWMRLGDLLAVVRMPMLLTVSGILAATKIRSGLSRRTVVGAASNYYLYLVWLVIYAITVSPAVTELSVSGPLDLVGQAFLPETTMWFVWELAVGVALLAALRKAPSWAVVAALVVLGMAVEAIPKTSRPLWLDTLPLVVFLAIGAYNAQWLRAHVEEKRTLVAGTVGLLVLVPLYFVLPVPLWLKYPVRVLAGVACALAVLSLAARLVRIPALGRAGSWVGQRTLSIYVIHFPLLAGLGLLPLGAREALSRALTGSVPLALVYPAFLVLALAAASLALEAALKRVGLGFLFTMPQAWRDRIGARFPA